MLEQLKKEVLESNLLLVEYGLVMFTWGNVSGIDRAAGLIVIKPSGVPYDKMTANDMVVVDLDGRVVEGRLQPSSDLPTHIELYRAFPSIGGAAHTHSEFATAFAQSGGGIPVYGTTHADYFYGEIPCTRRLSREETEKQYETNTGLLIAETFDGADPDAVPACLVCGHGPFSWGKDSKEAAHNAAYAEYSARLAYLTKGLDPLARTLDQYVLDKHYFRKHGKTAYYGQEHER